VDRPLPAPLDYLPPAGHVGAIAAGSRVQVPFGRQQLIGMVVGHAATSSLAADKLKPITSLLDTEPLLDAGLIELLDRAADYYHHPLAELIDAALPRRLREGAPVEALEEYLQLTAAGVAAVAAGEPRRAQRQRAVLTALHAAGGDLPVTELAAQGAGWRAAATQLARHGWLQSHWRTLAPVANPETAAGSVPLAPPPSPAQALAIEAIDAAHGRFDCFVLQGLPGSGKTEVYLRCAAAALARGGAVLVLVPEIGLTPQLVGRFRDRLAVPIAVLHSGLSDAERLTAWREARSGRARIVIGTRSAVFAPVQNMQLLIVDEEHDSSFKQQEGGCPYSARDLAVWRAQQQNAPVVLGSATPSLETLHNADLEKYRLLQLPRREDQAPPPTLALIDLRTQAMRAGLSGAVLQGIERHLGTDGQVLVYLNRRGYAPTFLCTSCGWIAPCGQCDARLTVHQNAGQLRCHYCGHEQALPACCPRCGFAVKPVGQGTERVAETLRELFPQHPLVRLDRDVARSGADVDAVFQAVLSGAARILVGTQMLTKGHHFPGVTLVVVLNADQGLFSTDFRAAERLAQTIVQVAGRAGRAARPGEVLIQTDYPDHPLLQQLLAGGYAAFAASALAEREAASWPPFSKLALLRASSRAPHAALDFLQAARTAAGAPDAVRILGPVAATMARRAGRYHAQLLLESTGRGALHRLLDQWRPLLGELPGARNVRFGLDVDPLDTQ
jgi:primosomal protein N' (replication factor Y) (superfamily II helicase)